MVKSRSGLNYIYIVDPVSSIYDELRERFRNTLKYSVQNFSSVNELFSELGDRPFFRSRTRTIVFVEQNSNSGPGLKKSVKELVESITEQDPTMNLIILTDRKETDMRQKWNVQSRYTLVYKNPNAILKITNLIMGFISKESLERKFISAKRSVQILIIFILAALLFTILSYFIFPEYF